MNIVVPMAGRGSRFAGRGVETPKPLIPVAGRPMIAWALESLGDLMPGARITCVILQEHEEQHGITALLRTLLGPQTQVAALPDVTEGQLCTVLAARDHLRPDEDLLIASCDTYIVSRLDSDIRERPRDCRGIISVADMPGDRWSFARTDDTGRVVQVAEKERISDHASTGLYYFSDTAEFLETGDAMVRGDERTRGEFYVIPVYQKYIARGLRVDISVAEQMWDMGTPEALDAFLNRDAS